MHGSVSFVEIGSRDQEQSGGFFTKVFGWQFNRMAHGGGWLQGPSIQLGLHGDDPQPQIYAFFGVPDLEAAIALVKGAKQIPRVRNCQDLVDSPIVVIRKAFASD